MRKKKLIECVIKFSFLLIVFISLSGCQSNIKADDIEIMPPSSKIPLSAGLYLPATFRNYIYHAWSVPIAVGDGLSGGAEKAFNATFNNVLIINSLDMDLTNKGIDVVITPEIISIPTPRIQNLLNASYKWTITCKWTIVDLKGKVYYMNTVTGISTHGTAYTSWGVIKMLRNLLNESLEDHYNKLLAHMLSTKWWENIE